MSGSYGLKNEPRGIGNAKYHLFRALDAMKKLTFLQWVAIISFTMILIIGNTGQLVSLNFWIGSFPKGLGGPITVLAITIPTTSTSFLLTLLYRIWRHKPNMAFAFTYKSVAMCLFMGFCNASNGIFLIFATGATPEIFQAFLFTTQIFWTLLFVKLLLGEKRTYINFLVITSLMFSAGGILFGAASQFSSGGKLAGDHLYWTLIFAGSMIPGCLYNVVASTYMRIFTKTEKQEPTEEERLLGLATDDDANADDDDDGADEIVSDNTTVKLVMLFCAGIAQAPFVCLYFPLSWAPWFGGGNTREDALASIKGGFHCIFGGSSYHAGCQDTFFYYIAFNISYLSTYVGSAYLAHYSASMTSMVIQLSAPIGALLLIIAPSLNVDGSSYSVGYSVGAIIFLMIGTLLYTAWEESTRHADVKAFHSRHSARSGRSRSFIQSRLSQINDADADDAVPVKVAV